MTVPADFFKSAFTVDNVIFGFDDGDLKVLLIQRAEDPFLDYWGLPGYFVNADEGLKEAAYRVLEEMTGLTDVYLEQIKTFGKTGRHPMGRVITVAYLSLIKVDDYLLKVKNNAVAQKAEWFSISDIDDLAFDHKEILDTCLDTLRRRVQQKPVGFELLPPKFTLTELQHLYEAILDTELDKRNFRKKILSMNLLIDLDQYQENVAHRPAKLYSFDKARYQEFLSDGYSFDLSENKRKSRTLQY